MTDHLTEDEVLAAIPALTRTRLVVFIEAGIVIPVRQETEATSAPVFRRIDFARLRMLCDLAEDLDLHDDALGVVVTLIDQLHATRAELLAIARAVEAEPPDIRARIGSAVLRSRG
jgi:chaperone modulatory protein CbpM